MYLRLFWLLLAVYLLFRGGLYYAQYRGSASEKLRARVESHFSASDITHRNSRPRAGLAGAAGRAYRARILSIRGHSASFPRLIGQSGRGAYRYGQLRIKMQ